MRFAGPDEYGTRYYDSANAAPSGRYLFESFPATRESLALLPAWNQMEGFQQWRIRPGALIIEGEASPQGRFGGGQVQKYILDPATDLINPATQPANDLPGGGPTKDPSSTIEPIVDSIPENVEPREAAPVSDDLVAEPVPEDRVTEPVSEDSEDVFTAAPDTINKPHEYGHGHSIRNINPKYGEPGRTQHCANCVVATDATLSGSPASAVPGKATSITVLEAQYGGKFMPIDSQAAIEAELQQAGPGSRAIIFGARGNRVGHFFNAINQNGTIRFLDGQIGGEASFKGFDRLFILKTHYVK